jgi:hypothetical protein
MDPVTLVLVPGVLGGIIVALIVFRVQPSRSSLDPLRNLPITTDAINMARIRVDGVGGFGLVLMALTVAWFVLRIRQHVAIGLGLGVVLAVVLILARRRTGPMPSSGQTPGANTTLSLDVPDARSDDPSHDVPPGRVQTVTA